MSRFEEAIEPLERGHDLGSKNSTWNKPSSQWLATCKQLVRADGIARDIDRSDPVETVSLAALAAEEGFHVLAAKLYRKTLEPATAENPESRLGGVRSAVAAGTGTGVDASNLDVDARMAWLEQAVRWLRDEMDDLSRQVHDGHLSQDAAALRLRSWLDDPTLAPIRDGSAIPEAPDALRRSIQQLWRDVEEIIEGPRPISLPK
jgi:hypothetical protein